jgi:pyridoxine 5-phosphate synthase
VDQSVVMPAPFLRLGVNIDHVATVRNARGGAHPDPVRAALLAIECGADGITAHLREDRRHIRDEDMARLKREISKPLNFEMAATDEMVAIALHTRPHASCLVPEPRAREAQRAHDRGRARRDWRTRPFENHRS